MITNLDVSNAFERYVVAVKAAIPVMADQEFTLQYGSKINGVAFRAYRDRGWAAPGTSNGFLGWTKREAYESLWAMTLLMGDIAHYNENLEGPQS